MFNLGSGFCLKVVDGVLSISYASGLDWVRVDENEFKFKALVF